MFNWGRLSGVVGILLIASIGGLAAQTATPAAKPNQAETAGTPVKTWTRLKLDAAKKRWVRNQEKFTDCQKQLGEQQKVKRLSLHYQGHFLQQCMARKP